MATEAKKEDQHAAVSRSMAMTVPFLAAVTEEAWFDFKTKFEAYRAMGGNRDLRTLFSSSVLDVFMELEVFGDTDTSEDAVLMAISALFAPLTVVDAYDRFRAITMNVAANDYSIEAVLAYNQAYSQLYKMCPVEARPADHRLRDLYLRNLRPQRLSHCVGLLDTESLAEARKYAVQEVKKLRSMQSLLDPGAAGAARTAQFVSSGGAENQRLPFRSSTSQKIPLSSHHGANTQPKMVAAAAVVQSSNSAASSSITCHSCGGRGHKSFECPSRVSWKPSHLPPSGPSRGPPLTRAATGSLPVKKSFMMNAESHCHYDGAFSLGVESVGSELESPKIAVNLLAHDGTVVQAVALLDTGSNVSLISQGICDQLKRAGVVTRSASQELRTAGGTIVVNELVECTLEAAISDDERCVRVKMIAAVHDVGEQVVLGYPLLKQAGLLRLLQSEMISAPAESSTQLGIVDADVGESDELDSDHSVQEISTDADPGLRSAIEEVIGEFEDLFDELSEQSASVPAMPIELLPGAMPKTYSPRRISPAMQQVIAEEVAELLSLGIVVPSSSRFASPVVLVKKKDGSRRMCVDYRAVNSCTAPLRFPIPNARALLERVAGNAVFAKIGRAHV